MWTLRLSAARTSLMTPGTPRRSAAHPGGGAAGSALRPRPKLETTSEAVSGAPSANFTPSRSQNVHVRPSFEIAQRVASAGSMSVEPSRYATSVSNTWRTISGTAPSSALIGSSVAGTPATPTRNSFLACAETGIIHRREKSGHASRTVMKKQARSIFDNDIALFLYGGTGVGRHPFRGKRDAADAVRNLPLGQAARDGVGAAETRRRGGERRAKSRT